MLKAKNMRNDKQKGSVLTIATIVIAIVAIAIAATWIFLSKRQTKPDDANHTNLTNVTYKSQNPSLPPQYSEAKSASYADRAQLDQIENLLSTYDISRVEEKNSNGCTGGTEYQYDLTYSDGTTIKYKTYKCANSFYGNMGGDVANFIEKFNKELKP